VLLQHSQTDEDGQHAPLETQRQFVMLLNQSPYQMVPANPDAMAAVDPGALPIRLSEDLLNAAAQIGQLRAQDEPPRWSVRALQRTESAPASVNLADLITVIAEDGGWRTVARYNTKNRSRQFLPVVLPSGARLLSVFVKQAPARPVKTQLEIQGKQQPVYLVALPKTSAADLPFDIRLVLAGTLPESVDRERPRLTGQEISVPVPRILSLAEEPKFGIPVIRTRWKVYLPNTWEVRAVDDRDKNNLTQDSKTEAEALDQLTVLSAANDLFVVLRDKQSSKLKYRAWANVYELEDSIRSSSSYAQSDAAEAGAEQGRVSSQVARERDKLLRNLDEFRNRIQVDETTKRAVVDQLSREIVHGLGEESLDIERQNREIFGDNTRQLNQQGQQKLAEFNFGVRRIQDNAQTKAKDNKQKLAPGLPSKIGTKGRQRNFDRSLSQLSEQNLARESRSAKKNEVSARDGDQPSSGSRKGSAQTAQAKQPFSQPGQTRNPVGGRGLGLTGEDLQGGFGGGGGGMGGAPVTAMAGQDVATLATAGEAGGKSQLWTVAGGLSLEFNVPEDGQQLTFTKVSGDPQLTLKVWPRSVVETGFGLIWTVVWLTVGCTSAVVLSRSGFSGLVRHCPKVLLILGLVGFFVLPQPLHWCGFVLFLLAGLLLGIQYRRAPQPA
jgi:hypothetical protein